MATMGMVLSFLEPVCTWLFGFKTTCLIIALGVPASSCLFSIAAYYNQFFHSWPSLICLIQLMLGKPQHLVRELRLYRKNDVLNSTKL